MIKSVLVLGGGTAGFLAAITLKMRLPNLDITVLRSKDIGIIGVGEGTTTSVTHHLHGYLGIDPGPFHREVEPVWKLGIRFLWGQRPFFDYAFLQQIVTDAASQAEAGSSSASLELSHAGFTLPELPGKTGRTKVRAAIAHRQISR